jgi:hypothetical protein
MLLSAAGRIGDGAEHVGRCAEGAMDLREQGLGFAGGGGVVDEFDAGHGVVL